jgi:hypothetical protein
MDIRLPRIDRSEKSESGDPIKFERFVLAGIFRLEVLEVERCLLYFDEKVLTVDREFQFQMNRQTCAVLAPELFQRMKNLKKKKTETFTIKLVSAIIYFIPWQNSVFVIVNHFHYLERKSKSLSLKWCQVRLDIALLANFRPNSCNKNFK